MKYRYEHYLPPIFHISNITGKKFIVPSWIPVHLEATLDDIEWIKPDYDGVKKTINENIKEENWRFESSSEPGTFYTVVKKGDEIKCNCAGVRRSKTGECKHMKEVKNLLKSK